MGNVSKRPPRIIFAAGPGNSAQAHRHWRNGETGPESQMSATFSGEFETFCNEIGAPAFLVASRSPPFVPIDGPFVIEHRPRANSRGALFHVDQIRYGLRLLISAVRFQANYAVVQSGTTQFFIFILFSLLSIRVIPYFAQYTVAGRIRASLSPEKVYWVVRCTLLSIFRIHDHLRFARMCTPS